MPGGGKIKIAGTFHVTCILRLTLFEGIQHITFHQLRGCKGDTGRISFLGKRCSILFHFLKEGSKGGLS